LPARVILGTLLLVAGLYIMEKLKNIRVSSRIGCSVLATIIHTEPPFWHPISRWPVISLVEGQRLGLLFVWEEAVIFFFPRTDPFYIWIGLLCLSCLRQFPSLWKIKNEMAAVNPRGAQEWDVTSVLWLLKFGFLWKENYPIVRELETCLWGVPVELKCFYNQEVWTLFLAIQRNRILFRAGCS
jgi:hypothetical protein